MDWPKSAIRALQFYKNTALSTATTQQLVVDLPVVQAGQFWRVLQAQIRFYGQTVAPQATRFGMFVCPSNIYKGTANDANADNNSGYTQRVYLANSVRVDGIPDGLPGASVQNVVANMFLVRKGNGELIIPPNFFLRAIYVAAMGANQEMNLEILTSVEDACGDFTVKENVSGGGGYNGPFGSA